MLVEWIKINHAEIFVQFSRIHKRILVRNPNVKDLSHSDDWEREKYSHIQKRMEHEILELETICESKAPLPMPLPEPKPVPQPKPEPKPIPQPHPTDPFEKVKRFMQDFDFEVEMLDYKCFEKSDDESLPELIPLNEPKPIPLNEPEPIPLPRPGIAQDFEKFDEEFGRLNYNLNNLDF